MLKNRVACFFWLTVYNSRSCVLSAWEVLALCRCASYWLAVWLSGNALASINIVALRQTRLVPVWVTVWTGKPSRYVTSQLGRLSLLPSVGWWKSSGLVLGRLAWSRRPLGTVLHSSYELGELSQWLCHDDSTINIFLELVLLLLLLLDMKVLYACWTARLLTSNCWQTADVIEYVMKLPACHRLSSMQQVHCQFFAFHKRFSLHPIASLVFHLIPPSDFVNGPVSTTFLYRSWSVVCHIHKWFGKVSYLCMCARRGRWPVVRCTDI